MASGVRGAGGGSVGTGAGAVTVGAGVAAAVGGGDGSCAGVGVSQAARANAQSATATRLCPVKRCDGSQHGCGCFLSARGSGRGISVDGGGPTLPHHTVLACGVANA